MTTKQYLSGRNNLACTIFVPWDVWRWFYCRWMWT